LLSKLCPSSCLHSNFPSLESLKLSDSSSSPFAWIDQPVSMCELTSTIHSSRKKSSPGLDRFDYGIITILLSIYNDLFACDLFSESWRATLLTFVPKSDGKGVRSIALLSCFLKILEKMVYRRF